MNELIANIGSVAVVMALVALIWGMRKEELNRREKAAKDLSDEQEKRYTMNLRYLKESLLSEIADLKTEMLRLRDERHKNTTELSEVHGLCFLLRDDLTRMADKINRVDK